VTRVMNWTALQACPGEPVTSFRGPYWFLSNFCDRPVYFEGIWYPGNEWAFQASKSLDLSVRRIIADLPTAQAAKAAGRQAALRPDWEQVKRPVMFGVNLAKYTQLGDLRAALLHTGQRLLIEGNHWGDDEWGAVPYLGRPPGARDVPLWRTGPSNQTWLAGDNWLGWTLMVIRDMLGNGVLP
jgi:ribA/ribD-fused uncharacterized protein